MALDVIGKNVVPVDVKPKATGQAEFVSDMKLPGMLYGKILRSPHAHARIIKIDTEKAQKVPGVKAVITFKDTSQVKFGTLVDDWYILAKDRVTFAGQEVAAVAAVDEETGEKALELIEVEYEELPAVFELEEAMKEGAPVINEEYPNNIVATFETERGNVEEAFERADEIFEDTFYTSQVYQAYLETMAAVCKWDDDGRLTMWLPVQIPSKIRLTYARALNIPTKNLRVIKPFVGGGFGAKMEHASHLVCAELARATGRPVKIVNSREEDFQATNPRVPMSINIKLAVRKDGTILGKKVKVIAGNGGRTVYGPPIMSTACYRADSLYKIENLKAEGYLVYTNTVPTGCYRGFGNAQMTFALESIFDQVAEKLDIDPAELRLKNSFEDGDISAHGWKINTAGLKECIKVAVEKSGWKQKHRGQGQGGIRKRGIGLACCNHVSGNRSFFKPFDGSSALIRIGEEGQVTLIHGESDIGQGQNTVYAQIAAEVLGANYEDITVATVDTQVSSFGLGSFATRGTTLGGNAVIAASKEAKKIILETAAEMLKKTASELEAKSGIIYEKATGEKVLTFGEAAWHFMFTHGGMPVTGAGYYVPDTVLPNETKYGDISPVYPFAAHIAEVEVDTETGEIEVINYWAVHDVGKVLHPVLLEGQVHGGVSQGIGWALSEDMVTKKGIIQNPTFLDYRIPGSKDLPKMHVSFVETDDPNGPFGAKGIGEPALNPVPAAVFNAIYEAIGIRFNKLPVTPEQVLKALGK